MSTKELQSRIRQMRWYLQREEMRPGCVAGLLSRPKHVIHAKRAKEALMEMAATGELERVGSAFRRARVARPLICRPWRKHSNEWVGLV